MGRSISKHLQLVERLLGNKPIGMHPRNCQQALQSALHVVHGGGLLLDGRRGWGHAASNEVVKPAQVQLCFSGRAPRVFQLLLGNLVLNLCRATRCKLAEKHAKWRRLPAPKRKSRTRDADLLKTNPSPHNLTEDVPTAYRELCEVLYMRLQRKSQS